LYLLTAEVARVRRDWRKTLTPSAFNFFVENSNLTRRLRDYTTKLKKIGRTLAALALVTILLSSIVPVAAGIGEKIGILVITQQPYSGDRVCAWT